MRLVSLLSLVSVAYSWQMVMDETSHLVCSGVYGGKGAQQAEIEVIFAPGASKGQGSLVIYEWEDSAYLGTANSPNNFICTIEALNESLCIESQLGEFLVSKNDTSIFTKPIKFKHNASAPIKYVVMTTGYYCVGILPLNVEGEKGESSFQAIIDFQNSFIGHINAAEYPKITLYLSLTLLYAVLSVVWIALVFINGALPLQKYICGIVVYLVAEMGCAYFYYSHLNSSGNVNIEKGLLVLISVMGALRNSISLFLLLLISMGYSVLRPSIPFFRVRVLAIIHFLCGTAYSIGTLSFDIETAGVFLIFFVLPLSLSMTVFLMWIFNSLNKTIGDLSMGKQTYKKLMFTRLYRTLLISSIVIVIFFTISTLSLSTDKYSKRNFKIQWLLLDGWQAILYLCTFVTIAILFRPSTSNRLLSLSTELATDENEADEFDARAERELGSKEEDAMPLRDMDNVVFDLGEEEDSDDEEDDIGRAGEHSRLNRNETEDEPGPPAYARKN